MKDTIRKNYKKVTVIMLLVAFVVINCFVLAGCQNNGNTKFDNTYKPPIYNESGEEKPAIIILPGMIGSNLVNAETNEPIWSGGALMNNVLMTTGPLDINEVTNFFANVFEKDKNGNSKVPIRPANMNDKSLTFGLIDEYRNLYKYFYNNYGKGNKDRVKNNTAYEVVVYQYDWTKSCLDSASDLKAFIDANNYKNNILVGHDMGGLVIDYYLTNENDKNNTSGVITLGTPHFGVIDSLLLTSTSLDTKITAEKLKAMLDAMSSDEPNPDAIDGEVLSELMAIVDILGIDLNELQGILDSFTGLDFGDKIPNEYKGKELEFASKLLGNLFDMVLTMPSVYDLLPSKELATSGAITIDGKTVSNYDDFISKVANTPNIKNSEIATNNLNKMVENRNLLYKDGKFITDQLNSMKMHYVYGIAREHELTTTTLNYFTKQNDSSLYLKFDKNVIVRKNDTGDSMVSYMSATATPSGASSKLYAYKIENVDHLDLYTPVSVKEGSHFVPIMVPNAIGNTIDNIMQIIDIF